MTKDYLDIVRQVLDRQVVDANNVPCGKVDDVEVRGGAGSKLTVQAILIGNGAASERLPELARFITQKISGKRVVKVPWAEVSIITDHIKLKSTARDLGLDEAQSAAFKIISSLPGSWKK